MDENDGGTNFDYKIEYFFLHLWTANFERVLFAETLPNHRENSKGIFSGVWQKIRRPVDRCLVASAAGNGASASPLKPRKVLIGKFATP